MVQHAKISPDHISVYAPKAMKDVIVRLIQTTVHRNRVIMAALAWTVLVNIRACASMDSRVKIVKLMSTSV